LYPPPKSSANSISIAEFASNTVKEKEEKEEEEEEKLEVVQDEKSTPDWFMALKRLRSDIREAKATIMWLQRRKLG
jgi:hypothetical protein